MRYVNSCISILKSKLKLNMKKFIYFLLFALATNTIFIACDKDDKKESPFKTVTLGAQKNTEIKGFLSITDNKKYDTETAFNNQAAIDIYCFYEEGRNDIALASPGSGIKGVFSGDKAPEKWKTVHTTRFFNLEGVLSVAQFESLNEDNALIKTIYNADEAYRKAKKLEKNNLYAFKTENNIYGILKVNSVTQGEKGSVEFTYIIKK